MYIANASVLTDCSHSSLSLNLCTFAPPSTTLATVHIINFLILNDMDTKKSNNNQNYDERPVGEFFWIDDYRFARKVERIEY